MKKFLLSILMIMPFMASAEPVEIDGIWYNLVTKAKTAEVTKRTDIYGGEYKGDVVIPETITHEGIEYTVTSIGELAFNDCCWYSMTLKIPSTIISIGNEAFNACEIDKLFLSDLESYMNIEFANESSCPLSHAKQVIIDGKEIVDYEIPSSITKINDYTFSSVANMRSVSIPNSVTRIGEKAFSYCSNLVSITIPNSVKTIGSFAFAHCSNLRSIEIPNSVTGINNGAFCDCTSLSSITIPQGIDCINNSTFYGCTGLTSINIDDNIRNIDEYAFYGCTGLTSLNIPDNIKSIGERAFEGCSKIKTLTIGNGIIAIYNYAFKDCLDLTDIYCKAKNVPSLAVNAFENAYPDYITLHVPTGSVDAYKATEPWNIFKEILPLESTMINAVSVDSDDKSVYYNLNGQIVDNPQKGIYIHNNKKIIIK